MTSRWKLDEKHIGLKLKKVGMKLQQASKQIIILNLIMILKIKRSLSFLLIVWIILPLSFGSILVLSGMTTNTMAPDWNMNMLCWSTMWVHVYILIIFLLTESLTSFIRSWLCSLIVFGLGGHFLLENTMICKYFWEWRRRNNQKLSGIVVLYTGSSRLGKRL